MLICTVNPERPRLEHVLLPWKSFGNLLFAGGRRGYSALRLIYTPGNIPCSMIVGYVSSALHVNNNSVLTNKLEYICFQRFHIIKIYVEFGEEGNDCVENLWKNFILRNIFIIISSNKKNIYSVNNKLD